MKRNTITREVVLVERKLCCACCPAKERALEVVGAQIKGCLILGTQGFEDIFPKKSDINKFEKNAWLVVWLTHIDIFGRLVNLLMTFPAD
ncbi:hypothetical protein IGI04_014527 [Brassica rapa subsp. trilocularis]|uniref:Uncharacterized protein n=1 Tax=Brassica rapa subsp. trilocularis TaxID=1813537 RepID=A0ABQ7MN55_BRACM|nr:hypothetical protein IGI04_014527 [Brassica rapa subsp. trilocularis]